jgi:hypothetical protein
MALMPTKFPLSIFDIGNVKPQYGRGRRSDWPPESSGTGRGICEGYQPVSLYKDTYAHLSRDVLVHSRIRPSNLATAGPWGENIAMV